MDLKNIENVEQFKGIFGKTGERKVSPTALYEIFEVPKDMHPVFTIKPFNPIISQEMKMINSDARAKADKHLSEKGFNVFQISTSIEGIKGLFRDVQIENYDKKESTKVAIELLGDIKKQYNSKNGLKELVANFKEEWGETEKGENYNHAVLLIVLNRLERVNEEQHNVYNMSRDLGRVFDIMIAHTSKVENYYVDGVDGLENASGEFTQDTLYSLQNDVRLWLDRTLQEESTLSQIEILGL